jgi:glycosyltransferase involved in cell wall biosynthesis
MKLVTFLITTYNSERWIEECLRSVLNQTHKNLQVLIVDDGSNDSTVKLIKQISDSRIELFYKEHSGLSKSLNFAMDKIKGNYIARLDSDDLCENERIEKQLSFLKQNPSYGILGTNFNLIDENGKQILKVRNPEKNKWIKDLMPARCSVWIGSSLMQREILDEAGGFNENIYSAQDWDLFLRVIDKTKFYNLQEYLTSKRIHHSNISESQSAQQETEDILLAYNNSIIKNSNEKEKIAKANFNIGYYYYYVNNFNEASEFFSQAIENGGLNLQFFRYRIFSKYLSVFIKFYRKYRIYKLFDWLRYFDNANKYLRSKF